MKPATRPPPARDAVRLLTIDVGDGAVADRRFDELAELLRPGDLLVVNDAATLPASLSGTLTASADRSPAAVELRLVGPAGDDTWWAALLGAGDYRTDTDRRPPPPPVGPGDAVSFGDGFAARVVDRSPISPRLLEVRFDVASEHPWAALYRYGRVVQYAHVPEPLPLWSVQTVYAGRPWAMEMPSAGRPLTWSILLEARRRGVALATLTHGAGLSATGDPAIDAALPLPERYRLPRSTVDAVDRCQEAGGRVIAVGTTVVRALEGAAATRGGHLVAGEGLTDLVLGPDHRLRVVDAVLTGMHGPGESHHRLLQAFAPAGLLHAAWRRATRAGYRCHELGDTALIWARRPAVERAALPRAATPDPQRPGRLAGRGPLGAGPRYHPRRRRVYALRFPARSASNPTREQPP